VNQGDDLQSSILAKLDQEELEVIYLTKCMQASSVEGKTRNFIGIRQTLKVAPKRKARSATVRKWDLSLHSDGSMSRGSEEIVSQKASYRIEGMRLLTPEVSLFHKDVPSLRIKARS
jgi:hypothetical protein